MSNNKTLDEKKYTDFLERKRLPTPNARQMDIIRNFIANKGDPKLAAEFFKVRACAGSGKTQLIIYTIIALIQQFEVEYFNIAVLAFNTKIAKEINDKLSNVFPEIKNLVVAYTFHSFVNRFFKNDLNTVIDELYTSNSPLFKTNLYAIIQARLIDLFYLNSIKFKKSYDAVEKKYIPNDRQTTRVIKDRLSNVALEDYLEFLGISSTKSSTKKTKKKLLCDENIFRLNPNIWCDYTMQGDLVDIPAPSMFKRVIIEVCNRLTSMGILYNLDIDLPIKSEEQSTAKYMAIITVNSMSKKDKTSTQDKTSAQNNSSSEEDDFGAKSSTSKQKPDNNPVAYIEIHSDDNASSLYSNSLRIMLGSFSPACFTNWTSLSNNKIPVSPLQDLDDFLLDLGFDNLEVLPLDELKDTIFVSRIADEVTKQIVLTVERLRSECICTSETVGLYEDTLKKDMQKVRGDNFVFVKLLIHLLRPLFKSTEEAAIKGFSDIAIRTYARILEYKVATVKEIKHKTKYLFIDEAQDVSDLFKKVLIHIIKERHSIKVMFAGDSMQAINSFAGGKGKVFGDLEKLKEELALNISIEEYTLPDTYRLSKNLVKSANKFTNIDKIPSLKGIACTMRSAVNSQALSAGEAYKISTKGDVVEDFLSRIVFTIRLAWGHDKEYSVALLARRHNVILGGSLSRIRTNVINRLIAENKYAANNIFNITASTIHAFKGKEADVVIILDADEGMYPLEDPFPEVQAYLFGDTLDSMDIDNRCLFYVAITRAKHELYFLYVKPSIYLKEIGLVK